MTIILYILIMLINFTKLKIYIVIALLLLLIMIISSHNVLANPPCISEIYFRLCIVLLVIIFDDRSFLLSSIPLLYLSLAIIFFSFSLSFKLPLVTSPLPGLSVPSISKLHSSLNAIYFTVDLYIYLYCITWFIMLFSISSLDYCDLM